MKRRRAGRGRRDLKNPKMDIGTRALTKIVYVAAIVCVLVGGIYIDTFHGKGMIQEMVIRLLQEQTGNENANSVTPGQMDIDITSKATIAMFGKEFMLCTKDGVKYFAGIGKQRWNDTFNMTSPVITQEGDYVAVGDLGGKNVRVYHKNGLLYDLQAEGIPIQFALNENGYLSLITKSDDVYRICIYNAKGTLLKERIEGSSGIYPLSSDISDDCSVFAISYLDTTDILPTGRLVLFYIDIQEGGEYTDSMFAGVEKVDELLPVIGYRKNGVLAVISDQSVFGIDSTGEEVWCYQLENTLDQATMDNKKYIVLALGDSVADKDGKEKGTVCWLDDDGREKHSIKIKENVSYLFAAKEGVVIGSGNTYIGATYGGGIEWEYSATTELNDLIPMERLDRIMLIGKEKATIHTMKEKEEKQAETPANEWEEEVLDLKKIQEERAAKKAEEANSQNIEKEETSE